MRAERSLAMASLILVLCVGGCATTNPALEPYGKVYYLDGAGNWGFGSNSVPEGLRAAGYEGDVEVFRWSSTLNPLLDQLDSSAARREGRRLAANIKDYRKRHPAAPVSIIALSAGTGPAVWACEQLDPATRIDSLVLLGSSLSHDYDISRAAANVREGVYVYYSPRDAVLPWVELVGTIDGKVGAKSIGQVGLSHVGELDKIVNIAWTTRWKPLGWSGGHTDCTCSMFVQQEIAPRILSPRFAGVRGAPILLASSGTPGLSHINRK